MGQLLQRVLKSLPTPCKSSSQLRTLTRLVDAFAEADDLALSTGVASQFQVLHKAFFCVEAHQKEDKVSRPLAAESLEAIETIKSSAECASPVTNKLNNFILLIQIHIFNIFYFIFIILYNFS